MNSYTPSKALSSSRRFPRRSFPNKKTRPGKLWTSLLQAIRSSKMLRHSSRPPKVNSRPTKSNWRNFNANCKPHLTQSLTWVNLGRASQDPSLSKTFSLRPTLTLSTSTIASKSRSSHWHSSSRKLKRQNSKSKPIKKQMVSSRKSFFKKLKLGTKLSQT
jgi:hypothetical protein